MIHQNLTPFFWGPKATSISPPRVDMAVCVRGTFRLAPGQPVEAIEDPIEQGFMSGDVWDETDLEQTGAIRHTNDFADSKPKADLLLKGTCYPPRGGDAACDVEFGVGEWSKTLRVIGPRAYKPGLLGGGSAGEPQPFTHMPLTWENAFGGPGFAQNPVGKGFGSSEELPTVEYPETSTLRRLTGRLQPAGFGPISPLWPQRKGKQGKKYGAVYRATRWPFYSSDFDWTYFNAAPSDQQLDAYLTGDEELRFRNLHPEVPSWSAQLPGLRVRVFVKTDDHQVHEPQMKLDTLYADLDDGKLYLTWRGLAPVRELDLTDVKVVLIASEPLASAPLPQQHYIDQLKAFEDDPVGLKSKFPPGFLAAAQAIEAAELAALNGTPVPDLRQVAANLPAGCPIPPWFLAAAAGAADPLGLQARFPPALFTDDPLQLRGKLPPILAEESKREAFQAALRDKQDDPEALVAELRKLEELSPPEERAAFHTKLDQLEAALAKTKQTAGPNALKPPTQPPQRPPAAQQLLELKQDTQAKLRGLGQPAAAAELDAIPSLDAVVAQALAPLDAFELPGIPDVGDVEGDLAARSAKLAAQKATLEARGVSSPLMGLFAFGQRLIDKMPRPADFSIDLRPSIANLGKVKTLFVNQGVSLAALAPLAGLIGRMEALQAKMPLPPAPARVDFAYQSLRGKDFSRQDLAGRSFARADLTGANLAGANLSQADLREATLVGADLTGANLSGARLNEADATRARFPGASLAGADLSDADLSQADLRQATLTQAKLDGTTLAQAALGGANLAGADLTGADLGQADLTQADLLEARLAHLRGGKARLMGARLAKADLQFADLGGADLRGANLTQADLSNAKLDKVKADGVVLAGARLDMASVKQSRLPGADLRQARSSMGSFVGSNLSGARLDQVRFEKVDLSKCNLQDAHFERASLHRVDLQDVNATRARFVKADLAGASATGKATFREAVLVGAEGFRSVWLDADLTGASFAHADLREAHFQGTKGERVNFFAANLKGASLRKADLKRTRFVSADLCGADLSLTRFLDTQFRGANCYDVKFLGAQLAACDFGGANLNAAQFDEGARP